MARRSSIRLKLISASTALLFVAMGLFAVMSTLQSRRLIDDTSNQFRETSTKQMRAAGTGQFRLLSETIRIAILQNDIGTLQSTVINVAKNDETVTAAAAIDTTGVILAHSTPEQVGKKASGVYRTAVDAKKLTIARSTELKEKSMLFMGPVAHEGTSMGAVLLAYSLKPLEAQLQAAEERKKREIAANLRNVAIVGLLSVLLGVLLTIVQALRITRPIKALAVQADRIASGDLEVRADVSTNDEIGALGERFNFMAEQVHVLLIEASEKASMEKELELASAIQTTLVPDATSVNLPGLSLAGYFSTASQCGGDWWSYFALVGDRTLVLIGDVTGHGVAPAMITAAAKGAVSSTMAVTDGTMKLDALLGAMNTAIHDTARGKYVMTCFAALYDPHRRLLEYANAGHNFPYVYSVAEAKLSNLVVRGNRLGDVTSSSFKVKQIEVQPEDMVVWYTDGLVECEDARGEEFGERRFRALIRKHVDKGPGEARNEIIARANEFYGQVPQKDDITLVIGKVT